MHFHTNIMNVQDIKDIIENTPKFTEAEIAEAIELLSKLQKEEIKQAHFTQKGKKLIVKYLPKLLNT